MYLLTLNSHLVAVVSAKHNVALSLGVGGVNSSARTVNWSLIFRGEGDLDKIALLFNLEQGRPRMTCDFILTELES